MCDKSLYMTGTLDDSVRRHCAAEAKAGDDEAKVMLGLYLIDQDRHVEGLRLVEAAAASGNSSALYWLGVINLYRVIPNADPSKSAEYFQKVEGDFKVSALIKMGTMYAEGKGAPVDLARAAAFFNKAKHIIEAKDSDEVNNSDWLRYRWFTDSNELAAKIQEYRLELD
jgi:TPR repeat protein